MVQFSHPYMTTGKTIALTRQMFVGKVMSLLFTMLSRLVITFLLRGKCVFCSYFVKFLSIQVYFLMVKSGYTDVAGICHK